MDEKIHVDIVVIGRVQGVWFRKYTMEEAHRLKLLGWVKNLNTGDVAVAVEGATEAVDAFIAWLHKGSPLSKVQEVKVTRGSWVGFASFMIIR